MSLTGETSPVEQLFIDRSIHDVLTRKWPAVEPWATMYVDDIREQRYGDVVWARIREDAEEAKMSEPEFYAKALQFFAKTSPSDGHPEVIQVIIEAGNA
ncbi:hypothetical protein FGLOB1_14367 [Fusarium globosum]|uniref:Uncharacterized protein n=1 Tax=Fusarium globosum TaxID=78864 RepID=A0A8H5XH71_9HYPO|nr:hypothetical protein FGLOB1_14367 [Fusarium globosum]